MMITLERVRAEDLETIIAIQRASFKAVYDKYQDEYDPYLEDRERIKWKLVERPNSYYYFVKDNEEKIGFLRVQTNEELTEAWLGTAAILPQYQGKGYGSEGLRLLEMNFQLSHNGICVRCYRMQAWSHSTRKTAIVKPISNLKKKVWIWST
jgi:predicted acetyltransferase